MRKHMLFVAFTAVVSALVLSEPGAGQAKGEVTVVVGGGELAPYFVRVDSLPPGTGPLALARAGSAPVSLDAPERDRLLAESFELYTPESFVGMATRSPAARYVPAGTTRPAYLQTTNRDAWYVVGDAGSIIDLAIKQAFRQKSVAPQELDTDPIEAMVLHQTAAGARTDPFSSSEYVIATNGEFLNGAPPVGHISGDDAATLSRAYVASLHNPVPEVSGPLPAKEYGVYAVGDHAPWFIYIPAKRSAPSRVEGSGGGTFAPVPELDALMSRILDAPPTLASPATRKSEGSGTRTSLLIASMLAMGSPSPEPQDRWL